MRANFRTTLATAALVATMAACAGSTSTAGTGTVGVSLTDAPACGYEQVNVTVTGLKFHKQSGAKDNSSGWEALTLDSPVAVDLLSLTDGVLQGLGDVSLPIGKYNQARLILAENSAARPDTNFVVLEGSGQTQPLRTPGANRSGSKIKFSGVEVAEDQRVELVVDFDACQSVVKAGTSGQYVLKPKLSGMLVTLEEKQEIRGALGALAAGAIVTAQVRNSEGNLEILKSDIANESGDFVLSPLPDDADMVDLVVQVPGQPLHILTDVPAASADIGDLSQTLLLGDPVADATGTGRVSFNPVSIDNAAVVSARQQIGSDSYVAASTLTNADGDYSLSLPSQTAVMGSYGETITFAQVADITAYFVTAAADGFDTQDEYLLDPADNESTYDFSMSAVSSE